MLPLKKYKYGGPKNPAVANIDIEVKNMQTGVNSDTGKPIFEPDYQFMLDGTPATSQDAARAFAQSQKGITDPQTFNEFVQKYLSQYNSERKGGGGKRGGKKGMHSYKPQTKARTSRKEHAGSEGLLDALRQYSERDL
jgi:hypothetical protein|tara:strand:- start:844 stop:1257 length:414 start_codon:yes stop_codon:yes gene_type:complete